MLTRAYNTLRTILMRLTAGWLMQRLHNSEQERETLLERRRRRRARLEQINDEMFLMLLRAVTRLPPKHVDHRGSGGDRWRHV